LEIKPRLYYDAWSANHQDKIGGLPYFPAHVLRHIEYVYIKKNPILTIQNVRFHELLLLFHFPDNFWSG